MSTKIHIEETKSVVTNVSRSFAYRRPRCPVTHLWRFIKRFLRRHSRRIARITAQSALSGSLIAGGILIGLNPIGVHLAIAGLILACPMDEEESNEEYNAQVREQFEERGLPQWALKWVLKGVAK